MGIHRLTLACVGGSCCRFGVAMSSCGEHVASPSHALWKPDCSCLEPVLHRDGFVNQVESGAPAMLEFLDLRLLNWLVHAKKKKKNTPNPGLCTSTSCSAPTVTGSRTASCSFNIQTLAAQETNGRKINSE